MKSFVYLGTDPLTGKEIRKWYHYTTDKDKQKKRDTIISQYSSGQLAAKDIRFDKWSQTWLDAKYPLLTTNPNTRRMYVGCVKHLIANFGAKRLSQINQIHVEQYVARRSGRAAELCLMVLNRLFKAAVKNHYLGNNPAEDVKTIPYHKQTKRDLEPFERVAVAAADLSPRERAYINLIFHCGLRRGEALALTPEDITDRVVVSKSAIVSQGPMVIKPMPKTEAGNRSIPIPEMAQEALEAYAGTAEPGGVPFRRYAPKELLAAVEAHRVSDQRCRWRQESCRCEETL